MIELVNISKKFKETEILKNISATFEQGKVNLIIGQSGSGKTVLLKSIVGIHPIEEGEIIFSKKNFSQMKEKEKKNLRKEIGMVFQGGALFDSSTVEENVMFPLEMFSDYTKQEKLKIVNETLEKVNVLNANKLFPAEISGGMKKRVAIARAIVFKPKYLFFDEPNSGLDPKTSIVIDKLIEQITKEYNTTTIVNTHDMNSVIEIGEKIIFIFKGRKYWEGTKEEIFKVENEELNNFVFASKIMKKMKE